MRIVILGAGRMGIRHALGICDMNNISALCIVDKFEGALINAKEALKSCTNFSKAEYLLLDDFTNTNEKFDVAILASTSQNRLENCLLLTNKGVSHILVEKPLGQSLKEVSELISFFDKHPHVKGYVNLNMRLYESFITLKNDLHSLPQFEGEKTITINTGTIGIGANGIHYLDLLYFLFDADNASIEASEIDEQTVPSARGNEFADFGGWAVIKFYKKDLLVGRVLISISARSTVFGGWDIVGSHGRITLNEIQQKRVDILRNVNSTMPINRYAADYNEPVETTINSPFLGDLTKIWLENLLEGKQVLPELKESLKVHKLMFEWLAASKTHKEHFPIT
jgi:predicted dehydrogenase